MKVSSEKMTDEEELDYSKETSQRKFVYTATTLRLMEQISMAIG
jgi:hypothetical protein